MKQFKVKTLLIFLFMAFLAVGVNGKDEPESPIRGEDRLPDTALKPVYEMFTWFLEDVIQHEDLSDLVERLPNVDFTDIEDLKRSFKDEYQEWVLYLIGFFVCIGIGVILLLLITPLGACVACCRCCGNCGGKIKSHDAKNANCMRICCGTSLFLIASVLLLGVIVMFVTSDRVRDKLKGDDNIFGDMVSSLHRLDDYKNTTLHEMDSTTLNAFSQTKTEVFFTLDNLVSDTFDTLDNFTQASYQLNRMADFTDQLEPLLQKLKATDISVETISILIDDLDTKLNESASDISSLLVNCTTPVCEEILSDVNNLMVTEDYSAIDVSNAVVVVDQAVNVVEVPEKIQDGITAFQGIVTEINGTFSDHLSNAKMETEKVEGEIREFLDDFKEQVMEFNFAHITSKLEEIEDEASDPADWVYLSMIGLASLLTLITACFFIGLLCGATCPRPSDDQYCGTRKVGADCLLAGIGVTFIFYWLLMVVLTAMFFGLGISHTEVCRHLVHFNESPVVDLLDDLIGNTVQDQLGVNISIKNVYTNCGQNMAAYTAFDLENNGLNISEVLDTELIDEVIDDIKGIDMGEINVAILQNETAEVLKHIGLVTDFPYDNWDNILEKKPTDADLMGLANKLEGLTEPEIDNNTLASLVNELRTISEGLLPEIENTTEHLQGQIDELETILDPVELDKWTEEILVAEENINTKGSDIINGVKNEKADSVKGTFHHMAETVDHEVREDVAQCFPVFRSFTQIVDTNCVDLLYQASAYWFALGWCLIFLLPAIIIAFKLVSLYRKTLTYEEGKYGAPYQAYYDEPEQMENHDTMLLSKLPPGARSYTQGMAAVDNPMYSDDEIVLRIPRPHVRHKGVENPPPYEKHASHYV